MIYSVVYSLLWCCCRRRRRRRRRRRGLVTWTWISMETVKTTSGLVRYTIGRCIRYCCCWSGGLAQLATVVCSRTAAAAVHASVAKGRLCAQPAHCFAVVEALGRWARIAKRRRPILPCLRS